MVLEQVEMHSNEKDINKIISYIKTTLPFYGYKIKKTKDEFLELYSIRVAKDLYRWIINFDIRLDRTGNLVKAEITRLESFVLDKKIAEQFKKRQGEERNTSTRGSLWRYWWLYIIISFVGSIILSFFPGINRNISKIGYSLMGILGLVLVVFFAGIFYNRYQRNNEIEKAKVLKSHLEEIIESIDNLTVKENIICWSCFKEVQPDKRKCPNCGVVIIKV